MLSEKARVADLCLGSQLLAGDRYISGAIRDGCFLWHRLVIGVVFSVSSTRTRDELYFSFAFDFRFV